MDIEKIFRENGRNFTLLKMNTFKVIEEEPERFTIGNIILKAEFTYVLLILTNAENEVYLLDNKSYLNKIPVKMSQKI